MNDPLSLRDADLMLKLYCKIELFVTLPMILHKRPDHLFARKAHFFSNPRASSSHFPLRVDHG
jgi:hypothetical protein